VALDDVYGFALALDVSPASLMVPREADVDVQVTPKRNVDSINAHMWIRGNQQIGDVSGPGWYHLNEPDYLRRAEERVPGIRMLEKVAVAASAWAGGAHPPRRSHKLPATLVLGGIEYQVPTAMESSGVAPAREFILQCLDDLKNQVPLVIERAERLPKED
jgi:hypothetical protein